MVVPRAGFPRYRCKNRAKCVFSALLKVAKYFRTTVGLCNIYKCDVIALSQMDIRGLLAIPNKVFQTCLFKTLPLKVIEESSGFMATSWSCDRYLPVLNKSLVSKTDQSKIEIPFQGRRVFTRKGIQPKPIWLDSLSRLRSFSSGKVRNLISIIDRYEERIYSQKETDVSSYNTITPLRWSPVAGGIDQHDQTSHGDTEHPGHCPSGHNYDLSDYIEDDDDDYQEPSDEEDAYFMYNGVKTKYY